MEFNTYEVAGITYEIPAKGYNYGCKQSLVYPLVELPKRDQGDTIKSPRIGKPHGLPDPVKIGTDEHLEMCEELMEVQSMVKNGVWPTEFLAKHHPDKKNYDPGIMPEPLRMRGLECSKPLDAAMFVYNDPPYTVPFACLNWIQSTSAPAKRPSSHHHDIHDQVINPIEQIGDALRRGMGKAFEAKYFFGRKRIWEIYGTTDNQFVLAPTTGHHHPGYPAGHAVAAGSSVCLEKEFYLDICQKREIRNSAYLGAMLRTLFGAHPVDDNLAGLQLAGCDLMVGR